MADRPMTEDEIYAAAVKYVRSIVHYETFTPSSLQRTLRCGYRASVAAIDRMAAEGIITVCPWTYQRADNPAEAPIMAILRELNRMEPPA